MQVALVVSLIWRLDVKKVIELLGSFEQPINLDLFPTFIEIVNWKVQKGGLLSLGTQHVLDFLLVNFKQTYVLLVQ
jgi:hypothetical protein